MKTMTHDYYDRTMSFLANTNRDALLPILANPVELEAALLRPYPEPESLEPDTWEATEAAEAEALRDDRAEEAMRRLIKTHPESWAALKHAIHKLTPGSGLEALLERIEEPSLWDWPNPLDDREEETE